MKAAIKKCLSKNTITNAKIYKSLSSKRTREMIETCAEAAADDSIKDVSWLKQFRKDVGDGKRGFYTTDCNFSNSHIYGIWNSIFGESGINPIYTPSIEHGLIFHNQIFNDVEDTARAACATFGKFRKEIIRQYTDMPVFCVGPYIHYAKSFYTDEQIEAEHKKNGRTLLVFPMHSTNTGTLTVEIENYKKYLQSKREQFDTVLINSFWWNINDPLTEELASEGYRVVSAGFRDDIMFMSRLKTLIQMSNLVVGDSIGTHVGYCLDCGVPFCYEPLGSHQVSKLEKERRDVDFCEQHMDRIKAAFQGKEIITEEQREVCDYYWGLSNIRTEEEIKRVVDFTRQVVKTTHGKRKKYNKTIHEMVDSNQIKDSFILDAIS